MTDVSLVSAAPLSNGRVQIWAIDSAQQLWSCWQNDFLWASWANDWNSSGALSAKATTFAAAPLSDGRLQAWAVDTSGNIWSCFKSTTDPNSSWTPWSSDWNSNGPLPKAAAAFAAAPLSDGRLQAWAVDTEGTVWACFKSTTDSDSLWTPWTNDWNSNGALQATATAIAAAPLSDGRLEAWAVDSTGAIWSCFKSTTDPSSPWTPWANDWNSNGPLPASARTFAAAPLSDGRLQAWAVDSTGAIWSCFKSTTGPNSPWTFWATNWNPGGSLPTTAAAFAASRISGGFLIAWAVDTDSQPWTCTQLSSSSSSGWRGWALFFVMQQQEQTQWCWAAVATSVSRFYDFTSTWEQCLLANAELTQTTCCNDGGATACNRPWFLDRALTTTGNLASTTSGTEPFATVQDQIKSHNPLGVRIGWSTGGGHVVIISGTGNGQMLTVEDPWYGESYLSYATLTSSYQGNGRWTHSYFTQR